MLDRGQGFFFSHIAINLVQFQKWSAEVRALGRKEELLKIVNVVKKAGEKKHI